MAKPYATEMEKLKQTFEWSSTVDISDLSQALKTAGLSALEAIGSGGSLSAAHALAGLHRSFTRKIGTVSTPLECIADSLDGAVSHWLLSAGGGNVDVIAAAETLIAREPRQIGVLCGKEDSPLADLCRKHPYVDLLIYPPTAGKDGFLATNSLLGFVSILSRAYAMQFGEEGGWSETASDISEIIEGHSPSMEAWRAETAQIWSRSTTLVLHGPTTRVGAVDLESKFTEAALGNLQIADYRNFAHGRHHWLAKRGNDSAVLAFITSQDATLAERTLKLIPAHIPVARIEIAARPSAAMISSLIAALQITGWAGVVRGIDPGRPGVPDFGRKLYHLPLPRTKLMKSRGGFSLRDAAAVVRKSGLPLLALEAQGEMTYWMNALDLFKRRLQSAGFGAVVLDYDGTVVDTRHRFQAPRDDIIEQLLRLINGRVQVAIATGRGVSARRDLQKAIPTSLWPKILIGYYNGAEVSTLDDMTIPDGTDAAGPSLAALALALKQQPELAASAQQTNRLFQITLESKHSAAENRLWDVAHQVMLQSDNMGASVTRSSHSVDIVAPGVSKINVLNRLLDADGDHAILTIGDRGRWPGNDYMLLQGEFSMSVDETSVDPLTCWNLGQPGQRGVEVTLSYLRDLEVDGGVARFRAGAFK